MTVWHGQVLLPVPERQGLMSTIASRKYKTRHARNIIGQAHMLTFTCYKSLPLLSKDRSRLWFVEALDRARQAWRFRLWAWVAMPEHAHVLLRPADDAHQIEGILKSIKQSVARRAIAFLRANCPDFLDRLRVEWPTGRVEYRFWQQGGGYDRNVVREPTLWNMINYIHENPVKAGFVERAEDWHWSSARWHAGERPGVLAMDEVPCVIGTGKRTCPCHTETMD